MNKNRTVVEVCLVIMLNNYYGWILLKSKMSFLVVQKQTLITSYYPSVFREIKYNFMYQLSAKLEKIN